MKDISVVEINSMTPQMKAQAEILILPKDDAALEVKEGKQTGRKTPSASPKLESKQPTTAYIYHVLILIILSLLVGAVIFIELHYRHGLGGRN